MNDITDLFNDIAHSAEIPASNVIDADVARGRDALARSRRRRARRAVAGVAGVAAAAAVVVGVEHQGTGTTRPEAVSSRPATTHPTAPAQSSTSVVQQTSLAVRLIAYTGQQLAGFTVDRIPEGWRLSGSTQYALTIDPQGDTNNDPDVFLGKLTVLLQSQSAQGLPDWKRVTVDGQPGVITDDGGQALTYNDGDNHTVVIQAPDQLAWTATQIVSFAEGVHVTGNAKAGLG